MYSKDREASAYALTNGVLWKYLSGSRETYVCPEHSKHMGSAVQVNWSYLMNAAFGWDKEKRSRANHWSGRTEYGHLANSDKRLLFSEIPFSGYNTWQPEGEGASTDTDAILQYKDAGGTEQLGVNHTKGRDAFLHVAFADGHVEKLRVPTVNGKPDTSQMDQLAQWLAAGIDVSFSGKTYRKMDN